MKISRKFFSHLKFFAVNFVAMLKDELISGSKAGFDAILNNRTGAWWTWELLNLHTKKSDTREQIHDTLQILELLGIGCGEDGAIRRQIYAQWIVQLVQKLNEFLFLKFEKGLFKKRLKSWKKPEITPKLLAAKRSLAETLLDAVVWA